MKEFLKNNWQRIICILAAVVTIVFCFFRPLQFKCGAETYIENRPASDWGISKNSTASKYFDATNFSKFDEYLVNTLKIPAYSYGNFKYNLDIVIQLAIKGDMYNDFLTDWDKVEAGILDRRKVVTFGTFDTDLLVHKVEYLGTELYTDACLVYPISNNQEEHFFGNYKVLNFKVTFNFGQSYNKQYRDVVWKEYSEISIVYQLEGCTGSTNNPTTIYQNSKDVPLSFSLQDGYTWEDAEVSVNGLSFTWNNGYMFVDPLPNVTGARIAITAKKVASVVAKGDLITIEDKLYRVLKVDGSVAEVLAMYNSTDAQAFGSNNTYAGSSLDTYCNSTFYGTLSTTMQNAIVSKTFRQDAWTTLNNPSAPISKYKGIYGSTNSYTISLKSTTYGASISRKCYVLSCQDVIDYLEVTTTMSTSDTTLNSENVWKMFWNQTTSPGNIFIWVRSADSERSSYSMCVNIRDGGLYTAYNLSFGIEIPVRPAFQIDLSKIEWTKQESSTLQSETPVLLAETTTTVVSVIRDSPYNITIAPEFPTLKSKFLDSWNEREFGYRITRADILFSGASRPQWVKPASGTAPTAYHVVLANIMEYLAYYGYNKFSAEGELYFTSYFSSAGTRYWYGESAPIGYNHSNFFDQFIRIDAFDGLDRSFFIDGYSIHLVGNGKDSYGDFGISGSSGKDYQLFNYYRESDIDNSCNYPYSFEYYPLVSDNFGVSIGAGTGDIQGYDYNQFYMPLDDFNFFDLFKGSTWYAILNNSIVWLCCELPLLSNLTRPLYTAARLTSNYLVQYIIPFFSATGILGAGAGFVMLISVIWRWIKGND